MAALLLLMTNDDADGDRLELEQLRDLQAMDAGGVEESAICAMMTVISSSKVTSEGEG